MAEIVSGVRGILSGRRELDRFRSELKEYFGVRHCFLVSSGKTAFTLILRALKELRPDRNQVLIPAFTCFSVPSSVVRAGLEMRLCDLQPNCLDLDFAQVSRVLSGGDPSEKSGKVLAVVSTHLYGIPANVARLRQLIRDPEVAIVEDAAQAMGETAGEGKLGTLGDVSFFSLARGKAFSVVEGGIILTNRDDLAERLNVLVGRLPGYGMLSILALIIKAATLMTLIHPRLFWVPRSMPFLKLGETLFEPDFPMLRMSPFQAGLAKNWREKLEKLRDVRKQKVNRWLAVIEAGGHAGSHLSRDRSLGLLRFPLRIGDKERKESLLRESARLGLGVMPVYPTSINAIPELRGKLGTETFPVAEGCARELVTLPTHGYLTEGDVAQLGGLLAKALRPARTEKLAS